MAKAKVIISAENKINQGLNSAKKNLSDFEKYLKGVESKLNKAFKISSVVTAVVAGFNSMKKAAIECIKEFSEADKVTQRLNAVWVNVGAATGKTSKQIDNLASSLEKQTYFSAESIKEASLLLAATEQLTEEGFDRALQASLDLAAALGEDVPAAAQTLSRAIQEPEAALSRLKTIGVSFTDQEKDQIKALTDANQIYDAQSIILDKVEQKYKDVAKAINNTPAGKLDNIRDVLSDIKKSLGGALLDSISPALDALYNKLLSISNWIAENTDSKANEIKTKLGTAFRKGNLDSVDLSEYTVSDLLKALDSARYNAQNPVSFLGMDFGVLETAVFHAIQSSIGKELLGRGYANISDARGGNYNAGTVTWGQDVVETVETTSEEIENAFQAFLKSYGKESLDYQTNAYEAVKQTAEDYAKRINDVIEQSKQGGGQAVADLRSQLLTELGYDANDPINLGDLQKILEQIAASYEDKIAKLLPEVVEKAEENLVKKYGIELPELRTSADEHTNEKFDNFMDGIASSLEKNMGRAGEVAGQLADNMDSMGPVMGAMMTALEYVLQGFGEAIGPMLDVITDLLLAPLIEIGKMLGSIIVPVLQILAPILKLIETPLLVLSGSIQWVAQGLQHLMASFLNWLADLNVFGFNPFSGLRTYDPGDPGNFGSYINGYINSFGNYDASGTASTETALSSASYRGATSVTINIYAEGPIVGDGGMRQFAQMIRDEFDALDYYGVGA